MSFFFFVVVGVFFFWRCPSSKACDAFTEGKPGRLPAAIAHGQHPSYAAEAPADPAGQSGGQSLLPQVQVRALRAVISTSSDLEGTLSGGKQTTFDHSTRVTSAQSLFLRLLFFPSHLLPPNL